MPLNGLSLEDSDIWFIFDTMSLFHLKHHLLVLIVNYFTPRLENIWGMCMRPLQTFCRNVELFGVECMHAITTTRISIQFRTDYIFLDESKSGYLFEGSSIRSFWIIEHAFNSVRQISLSFWLNWKNNRTRKAFEILINKILFLWMNLEQNKIYAKNCRQPI